MSTNNGLEWLSDRPKVHYGDCWKEHHDCALKEIKRLQEEVMYFRNKYDGATYVEYEDDIYKVPE